MCTFRGKKNPKKIGINQISYMYLEKWLFYGFIYNGKEIVPVCMVEWILYR